RRVAADRAVFRRGAFGAGPPAVGPRAVRLDAEDLAAGDGVVGRAERRAGGDVAPGAAVERAAEGGDRGDCVRAEGGPEVGPALLALVPPEAADGARGVLDGAGVEETPDGGEGGDLDGVPRAAAVGPRRIDPRVVDAEVEVAVVGLGGGGDPTVRDRR